ncbi:transcription initiation factor TFIIA large subunit, partial [Tremellales sp. Uapishka_1]
MQNVQVDFEEYGMDEDLLGLLQQKWEQKLLETRVADFERAPPSPSPKHDDKPSPHTQAYGNHIQSQAQIPNANHYYQPPSQAPHSHQQYQLPPQIHQPYGDIRVKNEPEEVLRIRGGAGAVCLFPPCRPSVFLSTPPRPALEEDGDTKPVVQPNAAGLLPGDEVIDSDLDDSDDGLMDQGDGVDEEGEIDIVFCVYDKVQRVKNKWKTVFKDGMIHINGKDYLFAKCNGEFEW